MFEGAAAGFGDAEVRKLAARGAAGASDLAQALAWIAGHGTPQPRVVVISDGVITAGVEGRELQARVKQLAGSSVERLDVVLAGGLRDDARRGTARPRRAGARRDGARSRHRRGRGRGGARRGGVDRRRDRGPRRDLVVSAHDRQRAGRHPGDGVRAACRRASRALDVVAGRQAPHDRRAGGHGAAVERAVAGAELAELEARLPALKGDAALALRAAIANRSVAARVLSSETSMLVLESDADYARYGIDRRALADVLVVGPRGVERLHRARRRADPARRGREGASERPGTGTAEPVAPRVERAAERPRREPGPPRCRSRWHPRRRRPVPGRSRVLQRHRRRRRLSGSRTRRS